MQLPSTGSALPFSSRQLSAAHARICSKSYLAQGITFLSHRQEVLGHAAPMGRFRLEGRDRYSYLLSLIQTSGTEPQVCCGSQPLDAQRWEDNDQI